MLQLRHLRTFLAAAETLSFTQAAQRVHLSQPSVTEQIQSLEHSVGQALFIRANNRLSLTPAGQRLAVRARELLAMADEALSEARGEADDQALAWRVAAPQALCLGLLVPVMAEHAISHPTMKLTLIERHSAATAQAVIDGEADVGIMHGWPADGGDALQAEPIARDQPVVVMRFDDALARQAQIDPATLAAATLIATMPGCRYRAFLDGLLQQHSTCLPAYRAVAGSVPAMLRMVAAGMGVALLPARAVAHGDDEDIVVRPLAGTGEGLPICLLRRRDRAPRGEVETFLQRLRDRAAGLPVAIGLSR